jgi:hypothetical protein
MKKCTIGLDFDYDCDNQATKKVTYGMLYRFHTDRHVHYLCDECAKALKEVSLTSKRMVDYDVQPLTDEDQTSLS